VHRHRNRLLGVTACLQASQRRSNTQWCAPPLPEALLEAPELALEELAEAELELEPPL
jgi:hypothetical protein